METEMEVLEVRRTVRVPHQIGLHNRMARAFDKIAQSFHSDILLRSGALRIDAKSSAMAFFVIGAFQGELLELSARGQDAPQAIQALLKLFVRR